MYYFTSEPSAFWNDAVHKTIPEGAVEVTDEDYTALMAGQSEGKRIVADETGHPVLTKQESITPVVPTSVSRFQARAALLSAGLLEAADRAVAASEDQLAQMAWSEATVFRRDSPTIASFAATLGLSGEDVDSLFIAAAQIHA